MKVNHQTAKAEKDKCQINGIKGYESLDMKDCSQLIALRKV